MLVCPSFSSLIRSRIITKIIPPAISVTQVRNARWIKPYDNGPEGVWRKLRGKKVLKVELPPFEEFRLDDKLTPDEIRSKMKEKGIVPPTPYSEKAVAISTSSVIFEAYIPPEGDGKQSIISTQGAKQRATRVEKKTRTMLAIRKLRSHEQEWDPTIFANSAQEIYIKAHELLAARENDALHEYVTEYCYPELVFNTEKTSIKWKFIDSLELPRVSHVRNVELFSKENLFSQVTVRLHTRQILAIYDRFGKLMHGSDSIVKDVLEYVVFEKHLTGQHPIWRMHGKITPDWLPPREAILKTFRKPPPPQEMTEEEIKEKEELKKKQEEEGDVEETSEKKEPTPALA